MLFVLCLALEGRPPRGLRCFYAFVHCCSLQLWAPVVYRPWWWLVPPAEPSFLADFAVPTDFLPLRKIAAYDAVLKVSDCSANNYSWCYYCCCYSTSWF